jgi:acetolactate synthase-1/2/3 large subunit
MPATTPPGRTGGQILVDALRIHGTRRVFCVPGESFLAALDALHDARQDIDLVVCRQEGGAAFMAEAHGKLTGEPGICFVTRGPGATNASIGVHTASQDATPMILFIGQVARGARGREAWQEIDFRQMFGGIAKWVDQIEDATRLPEYINRAFHVATSGRPGPVVLALPEDMLEDVVVVEDCPRYRKAISAPMAADMATLADLLHQAQRPLMILGGAGWTQQGCQDIQHFAESFSLPVACAFRRQDLFDNRHPLYAGEAGLGMDPRLAQRIQDADLIISVGARLGETTTQGYTLVSVPRPRQRFVHVHPDPEELGKVYHCDLALNASVVGFAQAAAALTPRTQPAWAAWAQAAAADYEANSRPGPMPGEVDLGRIMVRLRDTLPADSVICNGAGNYTLWVQRFYQYRGLRTQLAPASGTMGYGLPAAIACKLAHPQRTVVSFAGDGCFLMTSQELATAVQYGANVVVVVVNNGMYGSIRMHQERHYPERVVGTELFNPDFAELARVYGVHGEVVEHTDAFEPAWQRALAAGKPALIELRISPEALSPRASVSSVRAAHRAAVA